jgi:pyrimidine deaminase RibD-like protein
MSARHERYLRLATAHAAKSRHPRWKVGAVVIAAGRVLGAGANEPKVDPRTAGIPLASCSIHAEVAALRGVEAEGATVYVARLTRHGRWGTAKPCWRCERVLTASGVRRVVWTMEDGTYGVTLVGQFKQNT